MYKVCDEEFAMFKEVVQWAWDSHKIELVDEDDIVTEEDKQDACHQLSDMIHEKQIYGSID
jgi:hypothetical protein